ncbi:MAG: hypothetical protein PGN33_14135 [Methylobacterium radiotolerans]
MPHRSEPALDPYVALTAIRTFAKVALENEEPTDRAYELIVREILQAAEKALAGDPGGKGD